MALCSAQHQFTNRVERHTSPSSCMRTKAYVTAFAQCSSIVKCSRVQSSERPIPRNCFAIMPACEFLNSQTRLRNYSRPRSWRVRPSSFIIRFYTTTCVAIPAWSNPGRYKVSSPFMRWKRMSVSCTAPVRAWPRCKYPVTFGGGVMMTNFLPVCARLVSDAGLKKPSFSHHGYQPLSTYFGLYPAAISGRSYFIMKRHRRNVMLCYLFITNQLNIGGGGLLISLLLSCKL